MNEYGRYMRNFFKYRDLLKLLVLKDIKIKYKRSVLGVVWSLLNPLLTMTILTLVFKELFRFNIENFAAYVISGQVLFSFFSEATSLAMSSIYSSGQIIKKVYIPKYIFPVSKVLYSLVNMCFSFIAVLIVCLTTGVALKATLLFSFISIFYIFVFSVGVGLILCSIVVFFRDIEHIYGVFLTAWMYATPIIYPMEIMPDKYMFLLNGNPLYYFITHFREGLLYGSIPTWELNVQCASYAFVTLLAGVYLFKRRQDQFILYI
ncbi:ABC transporter permease [Paenibacillus sp. MMS18-CY102]|uniref:ABC transporter permease n=1 Tax=Paenibacillus sp. MMS18-CY102 TaxID=2682849 RepID=UPI0013662BDE|nr:ABC transporter permease [Paenibacillus sp. MMS18-CY102]MWC27306.1 ABC transporter permease [Paenibacillus sp. MMS18-CY102]